MLVLELDMLVLELGMVDLELNMFGLELDVLGLELNMISFEPSELNIELVLLDKCEIEVGAELSERVEGGSEEVETEEEGDMQEDHIVAHDGELLVPA